MSDNLKQISTEDLVDILSTQTSLFIHLHTEGASEIEFQQCKQLIQAVQEEINSRKKSNQNSR